MHLWHALENVSHLRHKIDALLPIQKEAHLIAFEIAFGPLLQQVWIDYVALDAATECLWVERLVFGGVRLVQGDCL